MQFIFHTCIYGDIKETAQEYICNYKSNSVKTFELKTADWEHLDSVNSGDLCDWSGLSVPEPQLWKLYTAGSRVGCEPTTLFLWGRIW